MSSPSSSSTAASPTNRISPSAPKRNRHAQKYRLRVTAGTSYDRSTHVLVPVNAPQTLHLNSPHMLLSLCVRIRHFTGVPASAPTTSPYFEHALHTSDQYSISFSFIPLVDISGSDLVFGNDFDNPIRDRLPPGFSNALRIAKWLIDPGLEGDPYADKPYLYGPALSSWNIFRVCHKIFEPGEGKTVNETAGHGTATSSASDKSTTSPIPSEILNSKLSDPKSWHIPNADSFHDDIVEENTNQQPSQDGNSRPPIPPDSSTRKKHFLTPSNLKAFTFEAGRLYQSDFGNPYLDFNDFSLKLPGFSVNVIRYVNEKTHQLRYVLKNRSTGDVYAVVIFSLLFGEDFDDEGAGVDVDANVETGIGTAGPSSADNADAAPVVKRSDPKVGRPISDPSHGRGEFGDEPPPSADDVD